MKCQLEYLPTQVGTTGFLIKSVLAVARQRTKGPNLSAGLAGEGEDYPISGLSLVVENSSSISIGLFIAQSERQSNWTSMHTQIDMISVPSTRAWLTEWPHKYHERRNYY